MRYITVWNWYKRRFPWLTLERAESTNDSDGPCWGSWVEEERWMTPWQWVAKGWRDGTIGGGSVTVTPNWRSGIDGGRDGNGREEIGYGVWRGEQKNRGRGEGDCGRGERRNRGCGEGDHGRGEGRNRRRGRRCGITRSRGITANRGGRRSCGGGRRWWRCGGSGGLFFFNFWRGEGLRSANCRVNPAIIVIAVLIALNNSCFLY